jgi:hypothetical protein
MVEAIYSVSVPKTSQELEQAIQRYKASVRHPLNLLAIELLEKIVIKAS